MSKNKDGSKKNGDLQQKNLIRDVYLKGTVTIIYPCKVGVESVVFGRLDLEVSSVTQEDVNMSHHCVPTSPKHHETSDALQGRNKKGSKLKNSIEMQHYI